MDGYPSNKHPSIKDPLIFYPIRIQSIIQWISNGWFQLLSTGYQDTVGKATTVAQTLYSVVALLQAI
jgi:hypothetical protein